MTDERREVNEVSGEEARAMFSPDDAHARDHERLDAAWAAWDKLGRPAGRVTDARKRAARRTLGLRITAHLAVHHGEQLGVGWSYVDVYERHARDLTPAVDL